MAYNQDRVAQLTPRQKTRFDYLNKQGRSAEAKKFLRSNTRLDSGMGAPPPVPTVTPDDDMFNAAVMPMGPEASANTPPPLDAAPIARPTPAAPAATAADPIVQAAAPAANMPQMTAPAAATQPPPQAVAPTVQAPTPIEAPRAEGLGVPPPETPANLQAQFANPYMPTAEEYKAQAANRENFAIEERQRIEQELYNRFADRMAPEFAREEQTLSQQLVNRGIPVGSELHNRELQRLRESQGERRLNAQTQAMQFAGQEQSRLSEIGQPERLAQLQAAQQSAIAAGEAGQQLKMLSANLQQQLELANLDSETKVKIQNLAAQIDTSLANLQAQTQTNIANMQSAAGFQQALLGAETQIGLANLGVFADTFAREDQQAFAREEGVTERDFQMQLRELDQRFQQSLTNQQYGWLREELAANQDFARKMAKLDRRNKLDLTKLSAAASRPQFRDYLAEIAARGEQDRQTIDAQNQAIIEQNLYSGVDQTPIFTQPPTRG